MLLPFRFAWIVGIVADPAAFVDAVVVEWNESSVVVFFKDLRPREAVLVKPWWKSSVAGA